MCARIQRKGHIFQPGDFIEYKDGQNSIKLPWTGFAQQERRSWWQNTKEAKKVEVQADAFAEHDTETKKLRWIKKGNYTIQGIIVADEIKIVTCASTEEDIKQFGHPRMPLIIKSETC